MIGHRNLLAFSTMVSLDEATPLFEHQIMSKQSFNYYMRPQDRDDHHHAVTHSSKGRGRAPSRNPNREGRSRGRSYESYGRNHNNYDRNMSNGSGRDYSYNHSRGRDHVPLHLIATALAHVIIVLVHIRYSRSLIRATRNLTVSCYKVPMGMPR